jgi:hypothetical protein
MKRTTTKMAGPKPRTIRKAARKPPPPTCMKRHPVANWGDPCPVCDSEAAAFAAQLRDPPAEMVIRAHNGTVTFFRIPKHLQRRRLPPGRRAR